MTIFFGKQILQIDIKEPIHRTSRPSEGAYFLENNISRRATLKTGFAKT